MLIHDGATALSRERTPEGFLRVKARIGRTGIHDYRAGEIGGPEGAPPDRTVRVYRPPDDVFDRDSLTSFAGKPVTLDHPPRMVDSANWKAFAVGHAGQSVIRDGDHVATDLTITDAAAVARAEAGAELSNGYWADFVFEPGVTPDGQAYDAVQRNIRGNHIALVDAGRCGASCRIEAASGDGAASVDAAAPTCGCGAGERDIALDRRSATIEGVTIETNAAGAAALADLQSTLDAAKTLTHYAVEVKDGEPDTLRSAAPDPAILDALVLERASVIDGARRLLGARFDAAGRSTAAIRRLVVERLLGPDKVRDPTDAAVAVAFDAIVAARALANPLATQMGAGLSDGAPTRDAAIAARDRYLTHAWKGEFSIGAA